ncbi:oligoendopeptidase F [Pelomyxa schiedti]|nr:oligoendopeptidase F [Pelomyxa schiedti]
MAAASSLGCYVGRSRTEVPMCFKWDLTPLFVSDDDWREAVDKLLPMVAPMQEYKGKVCLSAENIAAVVRIHDDIDRALSRVRTYANLRADGDKSDSAAQGMADTIRSLESQIDADCSWIVPEMLEPIKVPSSETSAGNAEYAITHWLNHELLVPYRRYIELILRDAPHTLSAKEEALLAGMGDLLDNPRVISNLLRNADMKFPNLVISDANGIKTTVPLSNGNYISLLQSGDRNTRREAYTTLYTVYGSLAHTFSACLNAKVKASVFRARLRNYPSALEASLHADNVKPSVYHALIDAVHRSLPDLYSYFSLRCKSLKLEKLNMYDMHVSIVPDFSMKVPYDQACSWVRESLQILGPNYSELINKAISERWIDVYENRGKRAGGYSTGCYDAHPYILMNYNNDLDSATTLAHELGHAMHKAFSSRNQPHLYYSYRIFVAEVASTVNQMLLHEHLMTTATDIRLKAYLLNKKCDEFRTTLFRQTMFAEFEKIIHEKIESGVPLTDELLCTEYASLNTLYHGDNVIQDSLISFEWERVLHFFLNFYVYKYATSLCAAEKIVFNLLAHKPGFLDKYLNFLSSGCSKDPLDLLADMDLDLSSVDIIEDSISSFKKAVLGLSAALESLP